MKTATNEWKNGLFTCFDDCGTCCYVYDCPCCAIGEIYEKAELGSCCTGCLIGTFCGCFYPCCITGGLRKKKDISGSCMSDTLSCYFCGFCQIVRELREVRENDWQNGLFACCGDCGACCYASCCPCCAKGEIYEKADLGTCFVGCLIGTFCGCFWPCCVTGKLREKKNISGSCMSDTYLNFSWGCCQTVRELREVRGN